MQLTTKAKNHAGIGEPEIPAGTQGNVIDITIEDGKARFLLDFPEYDFSEWYDADEIKENFNDSRRDSKNSAACFVCSYQPHTSQYNTAHMGIVYRYQQTAKNAAERKIERPAAIAMHGNITPE